MSLQPVLDFMLFTGLGLLGIGFAVKDDIRHLFRTFGFALFGGYWIGMVPYFLDQGDLVNAGFCVAGLPFFLYLAYHSHLSFRWREEHEGLRFIAGMSLMAGGMYYAVMRVPIVAGAIIRSVALQTVWLINAFGYDYAAGPIDYAGNPMWYSSTFGHGAEINVPILGSQVALVFACTAVQSMLIFVGAILATRADGRTRLRGFLATVPVIHVLNLVRNAGIIYLSDELGMDPATAHNYVGKIGSLLALIALAFIIFRIMPGVLENIDSLIELPSRKRGSGGPGGDGGAGKGEGDENDGGNEWEAAQPPDATRTNL